MTAGESRIPLAEFLNPIFAGNYEKLFTLHGGYLVKDRGEWKLSRKKIPEGKKLEYYTELARSLVESGVSGVMNPEALIRKINQEWTPCILKDRNISLREADPLDDSGKISFSSKITKFSFLSNFFPTLVLLREHEEERPEEPMLFYTTEHAYVFWKLKRLDLEKAKEVAKGSDPKSAKKIGHGIEELRPERIKPSDSERIEKMRELVLAKFSQNPVLQDKLVQTKDWMLIEATEDTFWGIGNDPNAPGENNLGKIIMQIRGFIASKL